MTSKSALTPPLRDDGQEASLSFVCVWSIALLVAIPWFWPLPMGPIREFWSDWLAWASFWLLLGLFPLWGAGHRRVLAMGWLWAATGNALIALIQFFDLENGLSPWIVRALPGHPLGQLFQPNLLATLLVVGGWALAWLMRAGHVSVRLGSAIAILLMAALASTASRSGAVLFLTSMLMLAWWGRETPRRTWSVVGAAVSVYVASAFLLPYVGRELLGLPIERDLFGRFSSGIAADGCSSRLILWSNMVELISVRPWQGWGPGALLHAHYSFPFEGARFCQKLSNAHNIVLQSAFVFGIPLTAVFVGLMVWLLAKTKPWAALSPEAQLGVSIGVVLAIHSLLEYPMWYGNFQVVGLWAAYLFYRGGEGRLLTDFFGMRAHRVRGVSVLVAIPLLGFVAWQYVKVSQPYLAPGDRMAAYRDHPVEKAQNLVLFRDHLLIGQMVQTELTPATAPIVYRAAVEAMKIAPDPQVIIRLIESAALLGMQAEVQQQMKLFERAWPVEYAAWLERQRKARQAAGAPG